VKAVLTALVKPVAVAVNCLLVPAESISRLVKLATALPAAVPMSRLVVPSRGPVPVVRVKSYDLARRQAGGGIVAKLVLSTGDRLRPEDCAGRS